MSKLEKLYEQALMKWGWNWLPATPPGTYLHSFDEFKQKMESDNEFYNKVVKELNQNKDEIATPNIRRIITSITLAS